MLKDQGQGHISHSPLEGGVSLLAQVQGGGEGVVICDAAALGSQIVEPLTEQLSCWALESGPKLRLLQSKTSSPDLSFCAFTRQDLSLAWETGCSAIPAKENGVPISRFSFYS